MKRSLLNRIQMSWVAPLVLVAGTHGYAGPISPEDVCTQNGGQLKVEISTSNAKVSLCSIGEEVIGLETLFSVVEGQTPTLATDAFFKRLPHGPIRTPGGYCYTLGGTSLDLEAHKMCEFPDQSLIDQHTLYNYAILEKTALKAVLLRQN